MWSSAPSDGATLLGIAVLVASGLYLATHLPRRSPCLIDHRR
jgi:hypothetical protein